MLYLMWYLVLNTKILFGKAVHSCTQNKWAEFAHLNIPAGFIENGNVFDMRRVFRPLLLTLCFSLS